MMDTQNKNDVIQGSKDCRSSNQNDYSHSTGFDEPNNNKHDEKNVCYNINIHADVVNKDGNVTMDSCEKSIKKTCEPLEYVRLRGFSVTAGVDALIEGSQLSLDHTAIPEPQGTHVPRWENREAWLLLLKVFICNILFGTLINGFGVYYMELMFYFDVSKGTTSLIQAVNKFTTIPAGK
jgi:hypothetical protein